MADVVDPATRSRMMSGIRGKNTKPELMIRKALHARGFRYRLHCDLPGKPDICLPKHRAVIFVHGCFWHGHDCARGSRKPRANADYWTAKLARNVVRDRDVAARLTDDGWRVVTVWECDLKTPEVASKLVAEVTGQAATVAASSASVSSPART